MKEVVFVVVTLTAAVIHVHAGVQLVDLVTFCLKTGPQLERDMVTLHASCGICPRWKTSHDFQKYPVFSYF